MKKITILVFLLLSLFPGCSKKDSTSPEHNYKFVVESSSLEISFRADTSETRLYCNLYDKRLKYHFVNCNGRCQMRILLEGENPESETKNSGAGESDSLSLFWDYCSSDPADLYPPDTTVVVETFVRVVYYEEDFDSSQTIPFETSVYDTVKVE